MEDLPKVGERWYHRRDNRSFIIITNIQYRNDKFVITYHCHSYTNDKYVIFKDDQADVEWLNYKYMRKTMEDV